jgi:hypothetical protein
MPAPETLTPPSSPVPAGCHPWHSGRWRRPVAALALLWTLLSTLDVAAAATRYVGSCGTPTSTTIGAAITASASGDTVLVCAGNYSENVVLDRNLSLASASGRNDVTINAAAGNALTLAAQSSGSPTLYPRIIAISNLALNSPAGYGIYGNAVGGSGTSSATFTNLTINSLNDGINLANPGSVSVTGASVNANAGAGLVLGAATSGTVSVSATTINSAHVGISLGGTGNALTHMVSSVNINNSGGSDGIDVGSGALSASTVTINTGGRGIAITSTSSLPSSFANVTISSTGTGISIGAGSPGAHSFNTLSINCSAAACNGVSLTGGSSFSGLSINSVGDAIFVDHTNGNSQTYGGLNLNSRSALGIDIRNAGTASPGLAFGYSGGAVSITSAAGGIYVGDNVSRGASVSLDNLTLNNSAGNGVEIAASNQGNLAVGLNSGVTLGNWDATHYALMIRAGNNVNLSQLTVNSSGGGVWLDTGVTGNLAATGTVNQQLSLSAYGSSSYGLYAAATSNATLDYFKASTSGYGISLGSSNNNILVSNFSISSALAPLSLVGPQGQLQVLNGSISTWGNNASDIVVGNGNNCGGNWANFNNLTLTPGTGGAGLNLSCGNNVNVSHVCTRGGARGMLFNSNNIQANISSSNLSNYTSTGIELDSNSGSQVQGNCFSTQTTPMAASPSSNNQWSGNFWQGVGNGRYQPGGNYNGVNGSFSNQVSDGNAISSCPASVSTCYGGLTAATVAGDWHFDEANWSGSSADVIDQVAANNGTAHGGAQEMTPGRICFGGTFNGSSAYVTLPLPGSGNNNNNNNDNNNNNNTYAAGMSLGVWVSPAAITSATIFQSSGWIRIGLDPAQGYYAQFTVQTNGNNGGDGGGGSTYTVYTGTSPTLSGWTHLVAVYDGARAYLYVNGALATSVSAPGVLSSNYSGGLSVGANANSGGDGGSNASGFFNGLIDEPMVFAGALTASQVQTGYSNQAANLNWDGSARSCPANAPGGSASAFATYETATSPASAYTGNINTKVAGSSYRLDVAALNTAKNAVQSSFTGSVLVQVIGSTSASPSLDAYGCPSGGQVLASPGTVSLSAGRTTVTFPAEANAWRYAKVKVSSPASNPTIISCSGDAFAIRPSVLGVSANDAACAATGCYLNSSATSGTPTHKAGSAFSLTATAYNSSGTVTSNYPGSGATLSASGLAAVSPATVTGVLATGSFSGSGGSMVSSTAAYSEVGSFSVQLQDASFAAVDANESASPASGISSPVTPATCSGSLTCSATVTVGRFIPDHFAVTAAAPTAACGSFTYFGQDFGTPFTLLAQNAANATTQNYSGALAHLALGTWSNFAFTASPLPAGSVLRSGTAVPTGSWSAGTASVTASQNLGMPSSPTPPTAVTISAAPVDSDGVTVVTAQAVTTPAATLYEGRVRMVNAIGPETWDLAIPMRVEYWQSNVAGWQLNTSDSCTSASVALSAGTLPAAATCVRDSGSPGNSGACCSAAAPISNHRFLKTGVSGTDASGVAGFAGNFNLWLAGSGAGNRGTVNVSASVPAWLQFNWTGSTGNPSAVASFGMVNSNPVLYRSERY